MIGSPDTIATQVRDLQKIGKKVVFTNGCFDILHVGHIDFLRRSRAFGDILVLAVNSDASVKRLKGSKRPIMPEAERLEILDGLEMVDFVCTFGEDTPLETILRIRPDVLVKGADWDLDSIVGRKEVETWGGHVAALPLVEGQSTTGIVERVLARYGNSRKKNP